jgi:hypothetical protein
MPEIRSATAFSERIWRPECRTNRAGNKSRTGERGEIDEAGTVPVGGDEPLRQGQRDRGLADSSRADHCQKTSLGHVVREVVDHAGAADHPGEHSRQVVCPLCCRARGRRCALLMHSCNRRDEAVTAAGNIGDVAGAGLAVAQRLAERADVHLEIGLLDERARPDAREEILLADNLVGALDQRDQDVERPAAEPKGRVALQQHALRRKKPERPES